MRLERGSRADLANHHVRRVGEVGEPKGSAFGARMIRQRTIREKISATGIGLHSGKPIKLELIPAGEDHGISFVRTDMKAHADLRAHVDCVTDTTLATTL